MKKTLTTYILPAILLLSGGLSSFAQGASKQDTARAFLIMSTPRPPSGGGSVPDTSAYYVASLETYAAYATAKSKNKIKKAVTFYKIKCKSCCLFNWSPYIQKTQIPSAALVKVTDPKLLGDLQNALHKQIKSMSNAFD